MFLLFLRGVILLFIGCGFDGNKKGKAAYQINDTLPFVLRGSIQMTLGRLISSIRRNLVVGLIVPHSLFWCHVVFLLLV